MAKQLPKIYYGLHFYPGVAEYRPDDEAPYRIFINENTIRKMGPTFAGKPVFVKHVNEVDVAKLEEEMDGLVIESFFNKADGKHWTKFAVTTDGGHEAIRMGWKLSNAYHPTSFAPAGIHNGLEFDKEVMDGVYDHLALVDDPRYEESMILTPEQFKEYNEQCEAELKKLSNSKDKTKGEGKMLFFKRAKVENAADLENTVVQLPKSKKELTIGQIVNELDAVYNMHGYANADHLVKVGDEEMSVKKLAKSYNDMKAKEMEMAEKNEMDDEDMEENEGDQEEEKEPDLENASDEDEDMENASDDQEEKKEPDLANKKKNSADKKGTEKKLTEKERLQNEKEKRQASKRASGNHDKLMNAREEAADSDDEDTIDLSSAQLARGKSRYGSA